MCCWLSAETWWIKTTSDKKINQSIKIYIAPPQDSYSEASGGNLAPSWGGRKNFSRTRMTFFLKKIPIFAAKISDDLFRIFPLVSLIFRIFTLLDIVHNPFLTRKTPFLLFSYFRGHPTTILLKILGGTNAWAVPHPKLWGARPPVPLGFRPCQRRSRPRPSGKEQSWRGDGIENRHRLVNALDLLEVQKESRRLFV